MREQLKKLTSEKLRELHDALKQMKEQIKEQTIVAEEINKAVKKMEKVMKNIVGDK